MLTCPICSGPLHLKNPDGAFCDRGHDMTSEQAAEALNRRLTEALWMALNALETEAEMWRSVAEVNGSEKPTEQRNNVDEQADLVRNLLHISDSSASA